MKFSKGKFIILISGIIIGFFIINNIGKSTKISSRFLSSVEYSNAVEERNKLYNEIEDVRRQNIDLRNKINKYEGNNPEKTQKLIEDMLELSIIYGGISGKNVVKGPGVIMKIQDGDIDRLLDTEAEINRKILHDNDVALVLNEIRKTAAEAIAINDHRILPNTGVSCYSAFIAFEDQSTESAAFYIYIIGNPEEITASLMSENNHIQRLILRKIKVEIEQRDEIIIPATQQNTELKYMELYEDN